MTEALTKRQKTYVGAGAVAFVGLLLWWAIGDKKRPLPAFFLPGQTVDAVQGGLYTMRLPRGRYDVLGDEVLVADQRDLGVNTDVTFSVKSEANDYTARIVFVDQDDPGKQFNLTIVARRTA